MDECKEQKGFSVDECKGESTVADSRNVFVNHRRIRVCTSDSRESAIRSRRVRGHAHVRQGQCNTCQKCMCQGSGRSKGGIRVGPG